MDIKDINTKKKEIKYKGKSDYLKPLGWKKIELYHDSDWNEFRSRKELDHPANSRLRRLYHNPWYLHDSENCECCRGTESRSRMLRNKRKKEKFKRDGKKTNDFSVV